MNKLSLLNDLSLLSNLIWGLSSKFPKEENYVLKPQVRRAILSVRLNVREGNVYYDKNKIRLFRTALGSLQEVEECLLMALELKYINENEFDKFNELYWLCLNKLKKLINSIKSIEKNET